MTDTLVQLEGVIQRFTGTLDWSQLVRGRVRRSRGIEVLDGLSLRVNAGEWYSIVGENGAGKTTVLRIVAGLLIPNAGEARVCGYDPSREWSRVQRLVGFAIADERSFQWRLSCRENLEFYASLQGLRGAQARARITSLLDRLDLGEQREQRAGQLSAGMKQRLALARALLGEPRVLLLDEPTRSLDGGHTDTVLRFVREEAAARDGCIMLVTHQLDQALEVSDRIGVLHEGAITTESTPAALAEGAAKAQALIVSVRGLRAPSLESLRAVQGVGAVRVASVVGDEQTLELCARNGEVPLEAVIGELTRGGASISYLRRGSPVQALIDRAARPEGKAR